MQLYQEYLGGGGVKQQKVFGSSLEEIRQNAIKAGINPVNLQQAHQFQDGSWTPFTQGQTATYKGSEGIPEQSFVGTNQEIIQQATAAGINPSNLFTGLDKFIPEADENIDLSQGSTSLLQGGQSNWFKTFQDAYVAGQTSIQESIAKLLKQQADITQEQREGYQADIDKATEGLEEAKDKPYGEKLGEELSEKYKLQEKIDKLGEIGNQLAQLQGAYDASVAQTEMSGITIGQSRGELSRKQREYASKASVLQAQSAVITDQYNLAKDIVLKYYDSAEAERTAEISRYQNLLDVATKAKLSLTTDDKNIITTQINLLLAEQSKQEANKDKIMALAIDPSTAEAFFNSGASLDDSYEAILEKMSPYMSKYAKERRLAGTATGGDGKETNEFIYTLPDGTDVDMSKIEGPKALKAEGGTYGEIFTWYDTNIPSMTAGAIKALLKDAGIEEEKIVDENTVNTLIEKIKLTLKKTPESRDTINTMLDEGHIKLKNGEIYPLTPEQIKEIKNSIKTPGTKIWEKTGGKVWDWLKGKFK